MVIKILNSLLVILISISLTYGQEVPILDYSLNDQGQVQLRVNSTTDNYYVLKALSLIHI